MLLICVSTIPISVSMSAIALSVSISCALFLSYTDGDKLGFGFGEIAVHLASLCAPLRGTQPAQIGNAASILSITPVGQLLDHAFIGKLFDALNRQIEVFAKSCCRDSFTSSTRLL